GEELAWVPVHDLAQGQAPVLIWDWAWFLLWVFQLRRRLGWASVVAWISDRPWSGRLFRLSQSSVPASSEATSTPDRRRRGRWRYTPGPPSPSRRRIEQETAQSAAFLLQWSAQEAAAPRAVDSQRQRG